MLEKIIEKAEAWMVRWSDLVLHPRTSGSATEIKPIEFFAGNLLLSYVVSIVTCLAFFAIYYRTILQEHVQQRGTDMVGLFSAAFPIYVILNFVAILVSAMLSFSVYNLAGSQVKAKDHINLNLELTFLEPLAASSLALLALLVNPPRLNGLWPWLFGAFMFTRIWYAVVSYYRLQKLHNLSRIRSVQAFVFGQLGGFFLFGGTMSIIIVIALAVWATMAGD